MRICIIASPRSGSQHVVELIRNSTQTMQDCFEPFTFTDFLPNIETQHGRIVSVKNKKFENIEQQVNFTLNAIDTADKNQNLILRLFLLDYIEPFLSTIVSHLKKNNFTFLVLKRKTLDEQLLSWAIASTTGKWNTTVSGYQNEKFVIKDFNTISWLYKQLREFDSRLNLLDIEYNLVRYENAITDLENILEITINSSNLVLKKQVHGNHYDLIENSDQVRTFIEHLKNGTQIY